MRVVILRGRVSIGHCFLGGVLISKGCSEDYLYFFSFLYFRYIYSCTWVLWPLLTYIILIFFICWCMFLSPILTCVVSFLFLCTCFLFLVCNLLFLFHKKMPWWVLFKVFQKYRLSKSTCHKLSSCKVFQEFVLG